MKPGTRTLLATPVVAVLVTAAPARSAPDVDVLYSTLTARAAALGGVDAAGAPDASAAFGNPAGLAFLNGNGFAAGHRTDAPGRATQSGGLTWRAASGTAGLALRACLENRAGTPAADALGRGRSPDAGWRAGAAAAFAPWRNVAAGIAVDRFKTLPVASPRAIGWSADAGVEWRTPRTSAGLFVRGLTWDAAGGERRAWSAAVARQVVRGAEIMLQADGEAAGTPHLGAGLAVAVRRYLEVRAGGREAGAGARWATAGFGLGTSAARFDYAVRAARDARTEHQAAIVLGFGIAPSPAEADRAAAGPMVEDSAAPLPVSGSPALDEPPVVAPPAAPRKAAAPAPAGAVFVVRAGPFKTLEAAAREVSRLYAATMPPSLQQEGDLYFVVVRRCASRAEADEWQGRARAAGVRCQVGVEPISASPAR